MAVADWPGLVNGPERLAWAYGRPGIFGILVSAPLFAGAAVRDVQAGMDQHLELVKGSFRSAETDPDGAGSATAALRIALRVFVRLLAPFLA